MEPRLLTQIASCVYNFKIQNSVCYPSQNQLNQYCFSQQLFVQIQQLVSHSITHSINLSQVYQQKPNIYKLLKISPMMLEFGDDEDSRPICIPKSFVRPVSLQRLREESSKKHYISQQDSQTKNNQPDPNPTPKQSKAKQTNLSKQEIYSKLLHKKLNDPQLESAAHTKPNVSNRINSLYNDHQNRENRKKEKARQAEQEALKECTFRPKLEAQAYSQWEHEEGSNNVNRERPRSLKQFLESQEMFTRRTQNKIMTLKEELQKETQKEMSFRPNSKRIGTSPINRGSEKVYERLFENAKSKQHQDKENIVQNNIIPLQSLVNKKITMSSNTTLQNTIRGSIDQSVPLTVHSTNVPDPDSKFIQSRKESINGLSLVQSHMPAGMTERTGSTKSMTRNHTLTSVTSPSMRSNTLISNNLEPTTSQQTDRKSSNTERYSNATLLQAQNANISQRQSSQNISTFSRDPSTSNSNQRQIINKTLKQLCGHCSDMGIEVSRINYLQLGELMIKLGFVKEENSSLTPINNDRRYLFEIWEILGGERKQTISLYNFAKMIIAIVGVHNTKLVQRVLDECPHKNFQKCTFSIYQEHDESQDINNQTHVSSIHSIGRFEGENWFIEDAESRTIKKHFEVLYVTRLNDRNNYRKKIDMPENTFQPQISAASKDLAEKYRMKLLEETSELIKNNQLHYNIPDDGELTHADLLILQKKAWEARNNKKIQEKVIKEEEEQYQMQMQSVDTGGRTSRAPSTDRDNISNSGSIKSNRYLSLYALSTNREKRRDKTTDEIEHEKNKDELTFKPNIQRLKVDNWQPVAKDVDKAIYRMHEARKMKEAKQQANGLYKQKIQQPATNRVPLLYLNVNIDNNRNERLSIFEGDDPQQVAEEFGRRFNLNEEAKSKLCGLIQTEIRDIIKRLNCE